MRDPYGNLALLAFWFLGIDDIEIMFKYECDVCKSRFNTMFCKVCPKLCDDLSPSQNSNKIVSGGGGFCMI